MIDLYSETTPNGQKIHIMLEETGLDYETIWVDIDRGEQFEPAFLKISPNNKIPAIVDCDGPGIHPPDEVPDLKVGLLNAVVEPIDTLLELPPCGCSPV